MRILSSSVGVVPSRPYSERSTLFSFSFSFQQRQQRQASTNSPVREGGDLRSRVDEGFCERGGGRRERRGGAGKKKRGGNEWVWVRVDSTSTLDLEPSGVVSAHYRLRRLSPHHRAGTRYLTRYSRSAAGAAAGNGKTGKTSASFGKDHLSWFWAHSSPFCASIAYDRSTAALWAVAVVPGPEAGPVLQATRRYWPGTDECCCACAHRFPSRVPPPYPAFSIVSSG